MIADAFFTGRKSYRLSLLALIAVVGSGCSGGSGQQSPPPLPIAHQSPARNLSLPTSFRWGADLLQKAEYLGPVKFERLSVDVQPRLADERGLRAYAQAASNPKSADYRKFLTPQEIGNRFGASNQDYATLTTYFQKNGMSVGVWPQRLSLAVSGTQAQMERAFGSTFGAYRRNGVVFVAPNSLPHFASSLPIASITNLVHFRPDRSFLIRGNASSFLGVGPRALARAYDYTGAYNAGLRGQGITIGIVGTGGISPADVPAFGRIWDAPVANVTIVAAQPQPPTSTNNNTGTSAADPYPGGLASPPPITAPCGNPPTIPSAECNPEDGEAQLDTEQIASLAPGASVNFYLAFNPGDCVLLNGQVPNCAGLQGLAIPDDEIQQAIADNASDILSLSYGLPENDGVAAGYFDATGAGFGPDEFAALASEGIAVFVASGDNGADQCHDPATGAYLTLPCASYPSVDPSVVSVGGTNTPVDDSGRLLGEITAWADQTTAGGNPFIGNSVGSGGGLSTTFDAPPWQASIVPAGYDTPLAHRGTPDIALNADPLTGPSILVNYAFGAGMGASGGTSAAAPDAAAMWALVLQACKSSAGCRTAPGTHPYRLGNPAPIFYSIYQNQPLKSNPNGTMTYGQVFFDILYGSNAKLGVDPHKQAVKNIQGYSAGPGYDLVTGVGAPFAGHLIKAVTGVPVP